MEKPDVDHIDGLSPGHLHRPEGLQPQPALDRGHGHGDLRLPAPALRPRRPAPLPELRPRDRTPDACSRSWTRIGGAAGRHPPAGPRAAGEGPQDGGAPGLRGGAQAGLRAGAGRRRAAGPRDEIRSLDKYKKHTIEVVVDRLVVRHADEDGACTPSAQSRRRAWPTRWRRPSTPGRGRHGRRAGRPAQSTSSSTANATACPVRRHQPRRRWSPAASRSTRPHGACPDCTGLGSAWRSTRTLVIPNRDLSLPEGAIQPWARHAHGRTPGRSRSGGGR